ncbi:MAG: protease modulator HflC [Candidatus Riflebacteria bacterium]|nr:protease modulator HflC [Candidatus Riflebacteria bacterium]
MHYSLRIILAFLLFGLILFQTIVLPLPEGFKAVITHFGKPDRIISESGPTLKWPWPIDNNYIFDCRKKLYNTKFTQTLTKDKKSIILLTYIIWQIDDPLKFLQSVGDTKNAEDKLDGMVSNAKNNVLGDYNLNNLVSTDPSSLKIDEIESKILTAVKQNAKDNFGINIETLGIKRLAYPEQNIEAIFKQMRAERDQYASKYRAEGRMQAAIIISNTKVEVSKINAEAQKKSAEIIGEADREAAEIYANAHKKGRDFYKFTKSLEAIEKMSDKNSVFILRTDQAPFNALYGTNNE